MLNRLDKTIVSIITPRGVGAVSLFRLSGSKSIQIIDKIVRIRNIKTLNNCDSFTIKIGNIYYNKNNLLDQVLVYIFKKPTSYTGEDVVEISCHGSLYIQNTFLQLCINHGAILAKPGEFTFRAYYNKKIDLCQAESILDLIHSQSQHQHKLAINNLTGSLSSKILQLRSKLINFISLIELELDFSEENIKIVNYKDLLILIQDIKHEFNILLNSFYTASIVKEGIKIVLIGMPNAGKSTLFNSLLEKDRSIVSKFPGTTRDFIEDNIWFKGYNFIFIDTAGVRESNDIIEQKGVEKTIETISHGDIIMYIFDLTKNLYLIEKNLKLIKDKYPDKNYIIIGNKKDQSLIDNLFILEHKVFITSAKYSIGINDIKKKLFKIVTSNIGGLKNIDNDVIITNIRHYEIFYNSLFYIDNIISGIMNKVSGDLLAIDLKYILLNLNQIVGLEISNEDILSNIFSKFCIGK